MTFINSMEKQLNNEKQLTENGAIGYRTSGKALLDLNFAVSSMRNWNEDEIAKFYTKAYYENPLLAVKWLLRWLVVLILLCIIWFFLTSWIHISAY